LPCRREESNFSRKSSAHFFFPEWARIECMWLIAIKPKLEFSVSLLSDGWDFCHSLW
jgi:hypothetical protein